MSLPRKILMSMPVLVGAAILILCLGARIADPDPVGRLRQLVFDTYMRADPRSADPDFPVLVVAIDEAALQHFGQWPWPRSRLAELVTRLNGAGAKTITFDLMMAEADRSSPDQLARELIEQGVLGLDATGIAKLPSNDARLAEAIATAPVILSVIGDQDGKSTVARAPAGISFGGDDPRAYINEFSGAITNLPTLSKAASGIGAVNWLPSQDQVVRRIPLIVNIGGQIYPSLSLETLRVAHGGSLFIKSSGASGVHAFGHRTGVESIRAGTTIIPADARGELWLRYAPYDPRRTISARRVLDGSFDPSRIRARHVFIGATAHGLLDRRATPIDPSVPGVEINAQALEQMLAGVFVTRPAYSTGLELLLMLCGGVLLTMLMARSGAFVAAVLGVAGIGLAAAISWIAFQRSGILLDPLYPSLSLAAIYLGAGLTSHIKTERERARVRSAFRHYLAPAVVDELAANPGLLTLGGEAREVTLMFADVRGFSRISEGLSADELVSFVNRLFTPLTGTILAHRGTIDKFMGDAVMAYWNAPLSDAKHARNACRAALAMLEDLKRLNSGSALGGVNPHIRMGIGLNTGSCVVGNVGSPGRFDYSVLGDAVNVTARLESMTGAYASPIILGERTASQARDFAILEVGLVTPRGKDRPERIHALFGDERLARSPQFVELKQAHSMLISAIQRDDKDGIRATHSRCAALAPAEFEAFYEGFARRAGVKED